MSSKVSVWQSLRTRATFFTLAVFVMGIVALSLHASRMLREDMERVLGEQQFQAVSMMARDLDDGLTLRLQALQAVAQLATPALLADPPALQAWLAQKPIVLNLFNGGAWVAAADGVAIADVPLSAHRTGTAYIGVDVVASVLTDGRPQISSPMLGKKRQLPLFAIVVPIHDAHGHVIGVISGLTDLDKPNFLDKIAQGRFGQTGGFLLIAPQHGMIVSSTNKTRSMQPVPAPGLNAMHDRYMQGFEGYGLAVSSQGVEELSAAKGIPAAGWFLVVRMPTAEAFAPIHDMLQRMLLATLLLTLLTGVLTWWILKRQLSPLVDAAQSMRALAQANTAQPLTVTREDEIGQLTDSFNLLLLNHHQREASLRASEAFKHTVINSLDAAIAVVDVNGVVVAMNGRWQQVALDQGFAPGLTAHQTGLGTHCLASGNPDGMRQAEAGLQGVLEGRLPSFCQDYPCNLATQTRWFSMNIMPLGQGEAGGAVIAYTDITDRRHAQDHLAQMNKRLRALIEGIPDPIIFKDGGGRWLITNEPAKRLYHLHGIDWEGKTESELCQLQPELATRYQTGQASDAQTWANGCMSLFAETVVNAEGTAQHFEVRKIPILDDDGIRQSLLIIGRDVTELRNTEDTLRIAATAFEAQQGMVITDAQRTILQVNRTFTLITGYSAEEVVGQNPRMLASGRQSADFYARMTQALDADGIWTGELWNRHKNGTVYPESLSISAVRNDAGVTTHYVGIFSDITERIHAQAQIDNLAFYDPLTQLPNRRLLLDRLEQAIHASTRHTRKSALLFVDLDNFKTLNDTLGHQQGDLLLVLAAQRLKTCIHDGDTVARLGSDEFVVILENLSQDEMAAATDAEDVGTRILAAFQTNFALDEGNHHATLSIGITLFGGEATEDRNEPLKRAELAMFQAKASGRNTLCFFEPKMQAEVTTRAALEADLREAVTRQQLLLHYQPQVVGAGRITGVEALVRWQHPQRGMVSPAAFIPLAEDCGLILPIGQWVLETACTQLAAWAANPDMAHLTMAVNVSAGQFRQANFVDTVLATLARTRANPKRLKLELTESMLVDDVQAIIAKMEALKMSGISFSLDDFGTGYSSLAYLKRLPLNQLKIDQGFVRNIVTDPNDATIAKMVVVLAESMGLSVIAEGVELQAQADFLAHLGCHAYQGYLFDKPLPLAALEARFNPE